MSEELDRLKEIINDPMAISGELQYTSYEKMTALILVLENIEKRLEKIEKNKGKKGGK